MQMKLLDIKWLIFLEKVLTLMAMTLVQRNLLVLTILLYIYSLQAGSSVIQQL